MQDNVFCTQYNFIYESPECENGKSLCFCILLFMLKRFKMIYIQQDFTGFESVMLEYYYEHGYNS